MIVGRDHAGPGNELRASRSTGLTRRRSCFAKHQDEIGVEMVDFKQMVYVQEKAQYEPRDEVEEGRRILDISGTELRRRLQEGLEIPDWFSFPAVVAELRKSKPPRAAQGFTVFFTGLSGSGKSTIANALMTKLMEMGGRPVTLLDGDVVRKHCRPSSDSPRNTGTSTSSGSGTSRPRSPRTAASRSARRSRPTRRPARTCGR